MDVYFEKLTLSNWLLAFFYRLRGFRVYYFDIGRSFRLISGLSALNRQFQKFNIVVADYPDLSGDIHAVTLEITEGIVRQIEEENRSVTGVWSQIFKTGRVQLYIKNSVSGEIWPMVRDYLYLKCRIEAGNPQVKLVIQNSPANRLAAERLVNRAPEPGLSIGGIAQVPWCYVETTASIILNTAEYFARWAGQLLRRGVTLRARQSNFRISKEILWGIGDNRRKDDFLVDGELIKAEEIVMYYKSDAANRGYVPIKESIANCLTKGYACVNFDQVSVPLSFLFSTALLRYAALQIAVSVVALFRQFRSPSQGTISKLALAFSGQSMVWEIFLSTYKPALNISFDDPLPSQIADTATLNLHGAKNGSVQWGDVAERQAITLAYFGYDVYFSWGELPGKYWEETWEVDQVIPVGYIWGHHFEESNNCREVSRRPLLEDKEGIRHIVAMFDETPSSDTATSEAVLHEFYRIGTELLERRPDTMVIVKPKAFDGVDQFPKIKAMLEPLIESGRMEIWDRLRTDATHVMAISDLVLSLVMNAPYLEALCCGRAGITYAPFVKESSPMYKHGFGKVIFDDPAALLDAADSALDNPSNDPAETLNGFIEQVDPYRDNRAMERIRQYVSEITGQVAANTNSNETTDSHVVEPVPTGVGSTSE